MASVAAITVYRQPAGGSCNSHVGYVNGNIINLSVAGTVGGNTYQGCINSRDVSHEFGHALGMFHEQQRCDRNSWVMINSQLLGDDVNWGTGFCPNPSRWMATTYDYKSVMQYDSWIVYPISGPSYWNMLKTDGSLINTTINSRENLISDSARLPSVGDFATMQAFY